MNEKWLLYSLSLLINSHCESVLINTLFQKYEVVLLRNCVLGEQGGEY